MNTKNIKTEDLIGIDDYLIEHLSKMDCCNSEHRQCAIDAMELYVRKYISPAMYLPETTIGSVVGEEIEGLGLNFLFDSKRKDLSRPNDEEIDDVLIGLAKQTPTPQLRDDFRAAWLLREAVGCVKSLYTFLNEPLITGKDKDIAANVLEKEIQQLQKILKLPMPAVKGTIELLIETEQKVWAEWYKEKTESSQ